MEKKQPANERVHRQVRHPRHLHLRPSPARAGMDDDEAKQRGMVAAIMGAQARLGIRKEHHEEFQAQKEAAEKKKKTTITAESFDKQVAHKMGEFFDEVFLPDDQEAGRGGLLLRRGETAGEDPKHLGCQDQRGTVQGTDKCLSLEMRSLCRRVRADSHPGATEGLLGRIGAVHAVGEIGLGVRRWAKSWNWSSHSYCSGLP